MQTMRATPARGGLYAARGEGLGDGGKERGDPDQRRGAVAQHQLGQKGDGAGPAPDGRRPEAGQPEKIGQPGHEAPVERRGDEHPLAGVDAGGPETTLLVVGQALEVGARLQQRHGQAGRSRALADVHDLVRRDGEEVRAALLEVALRREGQLRQVGGRPHPSRIEPLPGEGLAVERGRAGVREVPPQQPRHGIAARSPRPCKPQRGWRDSLGMNSGAGYGGGQLEQ